jgi:hypothetical protein
MIAKRTALVSGLIVASGLATIGAFAYSQWSFLLRNQPEQDACVFGTLSNGEYRAILEQATSHTALWPPINYADRAIESALNTRLSQLIGQDATLERQLASAHALLRSIGALYLNADGLSEKAPFEDAIRRHYPVTFNYAFDKNRIEWLALYPRAMWLAIFVQSSDPNNLLAKPWRVRIAAHTISIFDRPPSSRTTASGGACPAVPADGNQKTND